MRQDGVLYRMTSIIEIRKRIETTEISNADEGTRVSMHFPYCLDYLNVVPQEAFDFDLLFHY